MATTETISSNYAGEYAGRYISPILLSPATIDNGGVDVQAGIKYKWNIPKMELSGIIGNATCDFTEQGTITVSDRVLTVEDFEVNMKLCKSNYRPTWDSLQMGTSTHDSLAPTFADHLIGLVGGNVAQSRENTIWQGVNATAGEFDGFETLFTNQADQPTGYEIAGTTLSAANIVAQLQLVIDAASSALYNSDGFAIRVPTSAIKFYIQAQAALGYLDRFHVGVTELNFQGVPLIHCPGMSDNTMFATYRDNLWYGIGEFNDLSRVDVIDQSPLDGSDNVHVVMKWSDGVQVGNVEDVITYGITNSGN